MFFVCICRRAARKYPVCGRFLPPYIRWSGRVILSAAKSLQHEGGTSLIRYFLYVLRWVVLAVPGALFFNEVRDLFNIENVYLVMVISQAVMGAGVFFIDRFIFTSRSIDVQWEVKGQAACVDCGRVGRGYRIAKAPQYDRVRDRNPKFRCEQCSEIKARRLADLHCI